MYIAFVAIFALVILSTVIPFSSHPHWSVRLFDFGKIQLTILGVLALIFSFVVLERSSELLCWQAATAICVIYNFSILVRYTSLYRVKPIDISEKHSDSVTLLSANVLQFNTEYDRFLEMVRKCDPDIVLTMESNEDWDTAMSPLEKDYPHRRKVPLENTYGMHLYSKLAMESEVHHFVADDLPSIEAKVKTRAGYSFTLFCVHPPPPSPTEEANSKERDGELLSVAKSIREKGGTTVVVGDFNNVAWARSSVLFQKTSETIDPRIGRGLNATFHAKYWFLRFPIDQIYHTADVFIQVLKTLPYYGSDHFPLYVKMYINRESNEQEDLVEELEEGEIEEVDEMIVEGIKEQSEREEVATES